MKQYKCNCDSLPGETHKDWCQYFVCPHCHLDIRIANPSGHCNHVYYPENCEVCNGKLQKRMLVRKTRYQAENDYWMTHTIDPKSVCVAVGVILLIIWVLIRR